MKGWIVGIFALVGVFIVVAIAAIAAVIFFELSNKEIDLRSQFDAQAKANTVIYDKVWKTIQQKAQIKADYAGDFKKIYTDIMNARYQGDSKGAPLFKWIQEQNPTFSIDLYKDLSQTIEAQRAEFARVQNRLIDIKREHDNLLNKAPSCWFLGSRKPLVLNIVTSSKTENTFATGKEDDISLPR
jgi:hypothetical protein